MFDDNNDDAKDGDDYEVHYSTWITKQSAHDFKFMCYCKVTKMIHVMIQFPLLTMTSTIFPPFNILEKICVFKEDPC